MRCTQDHIPERRAGRRAPPEPGADRNKACHTSLRFPTSRLVKCVTPLHGLGRRARASEEARASMAPLPVRNTTSGKRWHSCERSGQLVRAFRTTGYYIVIHKHGGQRRTRLSRHTGQPGRQVAVRMRHYTWPSPRQRRAKQLSQVKGVMDTAAALHVARFMRAVVARAKRYCA